jgi:hypothetical protein
VHRHNRQGNDEGCPLIYKFLDRGFQASRRLGSGFRTPPWGCVGLRCVLSCCVIHSCCTTVRKSGGSFIVNELSGAIHGLANMSSWMRKISSPGGKDQKKFHGAYRLDETEMDRPYQICRFTEHGHSVSLYMYFGNPLCDWSSLLVLCPGSLCSVIWPKIS